MSSRWGGFRIGRRVFSDWTTRRSGAGAGGAVRIIWGEGRAFPSTNTEDL